MWKHNKVHCVSCLCTPHHFDLLHLSVLHRLRHHINCVNRQNIAHHQLYRNNMQLHFWGCYPFWFPARKQLLPLAYVVWREGTVFTGVLSVNIPGGRGVPHPGLDGRGVPHPRSGWWGYPIPGLARGYPIPGLAGGGYFISGLVRGVLHLRGTPHTWDGVPPYLRWGTPRTWDRVPPQTWDGVPPKPEMGYPPYLRLGTPYLRWGTPHYTEQHNERLLCSGRCASCVHTGGLSCFNVKIYYINTHVLCPSWNTRWSFNKHFKVKTKKLSVARQNDTKKNETPLNWDSICYHSKILDILCSHFRRSFWNQFSSGDGSSMKQISEIPMQSSFWVSGFYEVTFGDPHVANIWMGGDEGV